MAIDSALPLGETPPPATSPARSRRVVDGILGTAGEVLVTAGVLLAMYVVWQLFYTDVQSGRSQAAALDAIEWAEPVRVPAITADGGTAPSSAPDVSVALIPDDKKVYSPEGAPVLSEPSVATTFATLHVPRWGYDYVKPISEGTSREKVLDKLGIGHYEATAMPGAVGNFAVAGHRTTYGKPFSDINTLKVGDSLVVQTEAAWYVYKVTGYTIETPEYVAAIAPVPGKPGEAATVASITLTTCHPKFSAEKRFIVWGELEYWAPTGLGYPSELVEAP